MMKKIVIGKVGGLIIAKKKFFQEKYKNSDFF